MDVMDVMDVRVGFSKGQMSWDVSRCLQGADFQQCNHFWPLIFSSASPGELFHTNTLGLPDDWGKERCSAKLVFATFGQWMSMAFNLCVCVRSCLRIRLVAVRYLSDVSARSSKGCGIATRHAPCLFYWTCLYALIYFCIYTFRERDHYHHHHQHHGRHHRHQLQHMFLWQMAASSITIQHFGRSKKWGAKKKLIGHVSVNPVLVTNHFQNGTDRRETHMCICIPGGFCKSATPSTECIQTKWRKRGWRMTWKIGFLSHSRGGFCWSDVRVFLVGSLRCCTNLGQEKELI